MTTITKIKSAISKTIDQVEMKSEALRLQSSLGKAELEDSIKEKRLAAVDAAAHLSQYLENIGVTARDVKETIQGEVDNLQVQIALGQMESKESAEKVTDRVAKYAGQFESVLEKVESIEEDKVAQVKSKLSDYMTKMSALKASMEVKVESYKS